MPRQPRQPQTPKPPKPKVAKSASSAKPKTVKQVKQTNPTSSPRPKIVIKHMSVGSTWNKVAGAAPWVGGQSSGLNPGSSAAITRRRNSPKFKARGKKVIRPRITKHPRNPDNT